MPRRRRYYRRSYTLSKRYSNETYGFLSTISNPTANTQYGTAVLPETSVLGTRKTKNFTLQILNSNADFIFQYALIYVPQGTSPSNLNLGSGTTESGFLVSASVYEPNQNVILSGFGGGPDGCSLRIKSRLARNLNSGDALLLVIKSLVSFTGTVNIAGQVNYAVSYQ